MSKLTNGEIVDIYLNNRVIKQCVECQFSKFKDRQFEEDFFQDLVLTLLTYDNDKMNDAHSNNHFNALVTRIILNNLYSKTSPFYKTYYKQSRRETEITDEELNIADEE